MLRTVLLILALMSGASAFAPASGRAHVRARAIMSTSDLYAPASAAAVRTYVVAVRVFSLVAAAASPVTRTRTRALEMKPQARPSLLPHAPRSLSPVARTRTSLK